MNFQEYWKIYKEINLFAWFFTCIIISIIVRTRLIIYSFKVSQCISLVFIFASYYILLRIGKALKPYDIHGISDIARYSMVLFSIINVLDTSGSEVHFAWKAILFLCVVLYLRFTIDGLIRLFMSVVFLIKKNAEGFYPMSIEGAIAIFTSTIAIGVTLFELIG